MLRISLNRILIIEIKRQKALEFLVCSHSEAFHLEKEVLNEIQRKWIIYILLMKYKSLS